MLSPRERSEAIARFADERNVSLVEAAKILSLELAGTKIHLESTVRGLTACGISSYASRCSLDRKAVTCKRCTRS